MAELRSVDPRSLTPNPDNPRRTAVPKEMDQQLAASIRAIGLLQPPLVREIDGQLVIRAGNRRAKAAIAAGRDVIDVYVLDDREDIDPMAAMSENLVRVSMNPVDTWRAIERLEQQAWNEDAIANALALPPRTVKKLKLLGRLHPPMLDVMARGSMPSDERLRTIANAPIEDQTQVWKALKPKKGHEVAWWEVARALAKPRIPFSAACFGDQLAEEYGVVWLEDLFAPAGDDNRYTINADGFFGAQEAWMRDNLPQNGTVLPIDEHGSPALPKGAERLFGKPARHDKIGHYVNPHSGEIKTIAYRLPEPKKSAKGEKGHGGEAPYDDAPNTVRQRPDISQKGLAMIGDLRTDALHQALRENDIDDTRLVALLVLAFGGSNVSVQSGLDSRAFTDADIIEPLVEGGVLTADLAAIRTAARRMLTYALSCRDNMSNSRLPARVVGQAIGADAFLPTMATEEFLACLSRQALERTAIGEATRIGPRVKDTRAALVTHCKDATWRFPGALFALTPEEVAGGIVPSASRYVAAYTRASTASNGDSSADDPEGDKPENASEPAEAGFEGEAAHDDDGYAVAAE